jgi:hypothetical protein
MELVRQVPICIVWTKPWAGELGRSLIFHARMVRPDRIVAGYFAYWTTERPWGDNWLTHWFLPAVAIDAFYSHLLFVLPGIQQLTYGPGDVEGLRVTFRLVGSDRLEPISVVADDGRHREVSLDVAEAVDDRGRILVFTDVWNHKLGAKGALWVARAGANQQCFSGDALQSVKRETVSAFRLGSEQDPRRARPAWHLAATGAS